ncbi:unnamed protein product [Durusdinium trenchii]|uniref:Integrase catalytic domain-containing protein n=1 Tax=Durusdinium trenchii TaxID=1381693 RepID=A0ABP0RQE7_9DINO
MAWLLQQESVIRISFHQCMTGLRVSPEGPSRKDTSFVANHLGLAALLSEYQCDHGHEHLALQNGLPKKAQAYPTELVHIILQGISLSSTPLSCYDSSFPTLEDEETEAAEQVEEDEPDDAEPRRPLGELERRQAEQLAADQVKKVKLLHVNLGHISTEKMLVLLKAARAKEAVMRFVKDSYRCEQCQKQKRPIERRKATMPRTFSFNRYIDVVIFYIALQGKTLAYLNVICHGANFQQIQWLQRYDAGTPSSRSVWQAFLAAWLKPFGNPEVVLSDGGSEFKDCFERHLEQYGILQVISDAASPWQNGRVERHGGWLKEKAEDELSSGNSIVSSPEDLNEVPWQDVVADAYDLDTAGAEFARAQKLRQKARKLCVQFTSSEKVCLGELKGRLEQCNITDAKSLYASSRQNRRTAVELAIILEALTRARSVVRWSPHPRMVADTLTKEDISRSNGALEETLRSSRLSLWDEEAELERRRQCPSSKLRSKRAPSSFREELVLLASLINKDWGELSESDLLSVHEG